MTREEQIKFCAICKNQQHDLKQGIVCRLTNHRATFDKTCDNFNEDINLKYELESRALKIEILFKTASQGKRLANYLLDLVFYLGFSFIFGAAIGIVFAILDPSLLSIFAEDNTLVNYLFGLISGMLYYSILEFTTGRTIAKFITRTKVVTEKGEKPKFGPILLRSLCRFIPLEAFSFLGTENSGWHDTLSKTKVIEI